MNVTVIDFWATFCVPCQHFSKVFSAVADEYKGRAEFTTCNVEVDEELPAQYGVRNVPSVVILKDGEVVGRLSGAVNAKKLREEIDKQLND